jgi:hypothetical protein
LFALGKLNKFLFFYDIAPIVAVASEGYFLSPDVLSGKTGRGAHGYNNSLASMQAIFMARGPNFASSPNKLIPPFENVNVYPLICRILDIACHKHNASRFESVFANVYFSGTDRLVAERQTPITCAAVLFLAYYSIL